MAAPHVAGVVALMQSAASTPKTPAEIEKIVELEIAKLDARLKDKDMGIELTPAAKALLAKRGYDPVLGARPLKRTIQREIEDQLSEKLLFGEVGAGELVEVELAPDSRADPGLNPRTHPDPSPSAGSRCAVEGFDAP